MLAKEALAEQRGVSILIFIVVAIVEGVSALFGRVPFIGALPVLAISIVSVVLNVGICELFIKIYYREKTQIGELLSGLSINFVRKLGGMFWMGLWVSLWSMLLIVPGVIKSLAYSMTPYILADCPDVTATEALKLSMRMTKGHKGELFVLALSWIGWGLLIPLTLGILGIIYVIPYYSLTMAGYYVELRDLAVDSGCISPKELGLAFDADNGPVREM